MSIWNVRNERRIPRILRGRDFKEKSDNFQHLQRSYFICRFKAKKFVKSIFFFPWSLPFSFPFFMFFFFFPFWSYLPILTEISLLCLINEILKEYKVFVGNPKKFLRFFRRNRVLMKQGLDEIDEIVICRETKLMVIWWNRVLAVAIHRNLWLWTCWDRTHGRMMEVLVIAGKWVVKYFFCLPPPQIAST